MTKNLNHIIVINNAKVAKTYREEFGEILEGKFGKFSPHREKEPKVVRVSEVCIKPLFAPDHWPETGIIKQILKAKEQIDFAIFTFAESSGIADALIDAHKRKVKINGVLDNRQSRHSWSAKNALKNAGIKINVAGDSNGIGKLHHKMMAIDQKVSIFGSFNYTEPANTQNDENIIIVGSAEEERETAKDRQKRLHWL